MIIMESLLTICEASVIFEAAGAAKIYFSLKPNHHHYKVKLVQIRDTLCITSLKQFVNSWVVALGLHPTLSAKDLKFMN